MAGQSAWMRSSARHGVQSADQNLSCSLSSPAASFGAGALVGAVSVPRGSAPAWCPSAARARPGRPGDRGRGAGPRPARALTRAGRTGRPGCGRSGPRRRRGDAPPPPRSWPNSTRAPVRLSARWAGPISRWSQSSCRLSASRHRGARSRRCAFPELRDTIDTTNAARDVLPAGSGRRRPTRAGSDRRTHQSRPEVRAQPRPRRRQSRAAERRPGGDPKNSGSPRLGAFGRGDCSAGLMVANHAADASGPALR